MSDEKTEEGTRVCPSCGETRPASAFRSSNARTHCDVCHEKRSAPKAEPSAEDKASDTEIQDAPPTGDKTEIQDAPPPPPAPPAPPAPPPAEEEEEEEAQPTRSREEAARERRLRRAGVTVDRCPVLDLPLDAGPRSDPRARAVERDGVVMSARAAELLDLGLAEHELEALHFWGSRNRNEDDPS